ncbi:uncharacterized protein LOC143245155 isoform X2 [Tachypleus tridentatus]|uniref:uncharacterized protein LOC143245155 isoform X2 n=1 Tax=Tachypleus tridentatus TaxID=6853 RepID=UPI003FD19E9B
MASNNAPTHDFAPAWLKIPSYETTRPLGSDNEREGHVSRREEHRALYGRHLRAGDHSRHNNTGREREGKRKSYYPPRHHPVDSDDDSQHFYNTRQFGTGSSVAQPASFQSSVFCRPHSRHDFRDPSYHSKYGFSHHGESGKGCGSIQNKSKQMVSSPGRSSESVSGKEVPGKNFHQEFPSLHGETSDNLPSQLPQVNGGVWKNPRNAKVHGTVISRRIHLVQRSVKTDLGSEVQGKTSSGVITSLSDIVNNPKPSSHAAVVSHNSKTSDLSQARYSLYKALVPAKSSQMKKPVGEGVILSSKETITNGFGITRMNNATASQPLSSSASRSKSIPTPPPHMEILIKNPKARGNKSDFLKGLQSEMNELDQKMIITRKDLMEIKLRMTSRSLVMTLKENTV